MKYKELYFAFLIEFFGILLFFSVEKFIASLSYLFFHFIASMLMAFVLSSMISMFEKFKNLKKEIFFVLSFLIFVTSFFGVIFSIFIVLNSKRFNFDTKKEFKTFVLDENSINLPVAKTRFGEGAIHNISYGNSALKLNILNYIIKNNMPNKGKILKEALSDNNDEVRLMAFSVLSREEDKLNKAIFEKLEELKTAKDKEKIYIELGKLYWEFIYLGVVDDNLKDFYLNLAKENFEKVENNFESSFYLGRIYLREGNIAKAKELLEKVVDLDNRAIPYLAEVYYYERNFKKVKELMKKVDLVSLNANFYFNYKVWNEA